MEKHTLKYRFYRYRGGVLTAKRDVPYGIKLSSRMLLDELRFKWNKQYIIKRVDEAIEQGDKKSFIKYSHLYKNFV